MAVICVDISKYQAGFDMTAFALSGGLGVIVKASEGTSIKDSSYDTHRKNALAAGLKVASYHFFRSSSVNTQVDWYLKCAGPDQGERAVLDFEDSSVPVGSGIAFLKRLNELRPDLQLTVYTGNVGEEREQQFGRDEWLAANTSLWTAQYSSTPDPWAKQNWPQWSLWQYTDKGQVPGFSGPVDCNKFNGPDENFLKWMGPASEPAPAPPKATVTITTSGNVVVILNGIAVT